MRVFPFQSWLQLQLTKEITEILHGAQIHSIINDGHKNLMKRVLVDLFPMDVFLIFLPYLILSKSVYIFS